MKDKFKKLLKEYQRMTFHLKHHSNLPTDEIVKEALSKTHEALKNNYSYHFHKQPTKERTEMINLIQHYVSEAILPPILEKIEEQIVVLSRKQDLTIKLIEEILETLSDEKLEMPEMKKEAKIKTTKKTK